MNVTTKTALCLLALLAAPLRAARAAGSADDEELLAAPVQDPGMTLKLSGFADFRWARFYSNGDSRWQMRGIPENGAFSVGNLNLYLDGRLDRSFRSLIEVRFTYLPNGVALQGATDLATNPDGTLNTTAGLYGGTLTYDYAQLRAKAQWGGIVIERAWLEARLDQALTLRVGQFLTPYGIWNVDHGSPTLIDISPPFPIGQELFPRSQVGLEAYGSVFVGDARLGYHATVSNGRIGQNPQFLDLDTNLGVGGRVFVETGWVGELKLGASTYAGRITDQRKGLTYAGPTTGFVPTSVVSRGDEVGLAADVRWELSGFTVVAEYIEQHLSRESQAVTVGTTALPPATQPAFTKRGWYALVGYRLPSAVMPFGMIQYINDSRGDWQHDRTQQAYAWTAGMNWRIRPNVVLKASYTRAWWPKAPPTFETKDPLKWLATQVAWAF